MHTIITIHLSSLFGTTPYATPNWPAQHHRCCRLTVRSLTHVAGRLVMAAPPLFGRHRDWKGNPSMLGFPAPPQQYSSRALGCPCSFSGHHCGLWSSSAPTSDWSTVTSLTCSCVEGRTNHASSCTAFYRALPFS